jgi:hypothetical protein|tara:strand:+ start:2987 stop:3238 length:252 start_codon:yes stop_codon:yes gene_type:complete
MIPTPGNGIRPKPHEIELAALVETEASEMFARLLLEGVPFPCLTAGVATATYRLILETSGIDAARQWFGANYCIVADDQGKTH